MRHRSVWAVGLALGLGLCLVGIAVGQDPSGGGNWFTRLFSRGASPAGPKDEREPIVPALSPALGRKQIEDDYLRRLSVCDALQDIARETGDEALARKADILQMRAKDAYIQRINRTGGMVAGLDEATLEKNLAPNGANLTPLSAGTKTKAGSGQALLEGR